MSFIRKKLDKQGRLLLDRTLLDLTVLSDVVAEKIAICDGGDHIFFRKLNNLENCTVIAIATLDSKGRIFIPKALKKTFSSYELCVKNGEFIVKCFE